MGFASEVDTGGYGGGFGGEVGGYSGGFGGRVGNGPVGPGSSRAGGSAGQAANELEAKLQSGSFMSEAEKQELLDLRKMLEGSDITPSGITSEDGEFKLRTDMSDEDAKKLGAQVTREQFERYMNEFVPRENQLISSLGNRDAFSEGGAQADAGRSRAALERMRSRYGTSLSSGQQSAENRQTNNATTLADISGTNAGRQIDQDRDYNLRSSLLNIGNNLSSSATSGLTDAAINEQNRQNAFNRAEAAADAQDAQNTASTIGTVATIGAMIF